MDSWCPYCANQKMCLEPDCLFCFENSFASYIEEKVACWSDKNGKKPREVFKSCNKKFWFDCDVCFHEFETSLCNVNGGKWCPHCKRKTETKMYKFLCKNLVKTTS